MKVLHSRKGLLHQAGYGLASNGWGNSENPAAQNEDFEAKMMEVDEDFSDDFPFTIGGLLGFQPLIFRGVNGRVKVDKRLIVG